MDTGLFSQWFPVDLTVDFSVAPHHCAAARAPADPEAPGARAESAEGDVEPRVLGSALSARPRTLIASATCRSSTRRCAPRSPGPGAGQLARLPVLDVPDGRPALPRGERLRLRRPARHPGRPRDDRAARSGPGAARARFTRPSTPQETFSFPASSSSRCPVRDRAP